MIRSLFSAISGMRIHQTFMDVVGNNIANVNTTGYKSSRITFEDLISQTTHGAAPPSATQSSINPEQVGLGAQVAGTTTLLAQGNLQATQSPTDLAIQGDGYFILSNGQGDQVYTRDGSFNIGADGALANANGLDVLGWKADPTTGLVNTSSPLGPVSIPIGDPLAAQTSTELTFNGNLDQAVDATSTDPTAKEVQSSVTVYDSLGQAHQLTLTFTKTSNATNSWSWTASTTETGVTVSGSGTVAFNATNGNFTDSNGTSPDGTISLTLGNGATSPQSLNLNFDGLTQIAASSQVNATTDGQPPGALTGVTVDPSGDVTGVYSNGAKRLLGQVALSTFANPQGLIRDGSNNFSATAGSGNAVVGTSGTGGRGAISSGYLEMSNVDLTQEFSNMILAERGFEANSRVITVSDQMLQELVNLKQQ